MSEMPPYGRVRDNAEARLAFANGTEGDAWMSGWCLREGAYCKHDTMQRGGDIACPLLDVALLDESTPRQWVDRTSALEPAMYRCTKYEAEQV
jgi:hypothetical protein